MWRGGELRTARGDTRWARVRMTRGRQCKNKNKNDNKDEDDEDKDNNRNKGRH